MSFPCSLFKLSNSYLILSKYYVRFNYTHSRRFICEKYKFKKLIHEVQKTMQLKYDSKIFSPPDSIRGLKTFDKSLFKKNIQIPKIITKNITMSKIMPILKKYLLKLENLKPIQNNEYVLLNPLFVQNWSDIHENDRKLLNNFGITYNHFEMTNFTINYENWKADELLRKILPEDKDSVAGFSKIGHIIHLNLRDHVADYKNIIGQILLDKISGARTVVNKLDKIDNTYRNFQMEILCGDKDMQVYVKENHCSFVFDFSTVYWNPRLSTEHERVVNFLKTGDVLYDVFSGVGPFSIPAAKKKCFVFANDLNPESFKWLNHNAKINKIRDGFLKTFNKDGRDFILQDLKNDLKIRLKNNNNIYITMNLPALALEFLSSFKNLFLSSEFNNKMKSFPKVFVYCFAKGENPVAITHDLIISNLGFLPENCEIFNVRKVSSNKEMMRVSFNLTREILFGSKKRESEEVSPTENKKLCHGEEQKQTQKYFQSGGSEEFEIEIKGQSC